MAKALVALFLSFPLFALPLGNPWSPSLVDGDGPVSLSIGFYGDYVSNLYLQRDSAGETLSQTKLNTNAGMLSGTLFERFQAFGTFGSSWLNFISSLNVFTPQTSGYNPLNVLNTTSSFSWSVGGRGIAWQCRRLALGLEGQYFRTKPELTSSWSSNDTGTGYSNGLRAKYREWQLGAGASYQIPFSGAAALAVPYIGLIFGHTSVDMDNAVRDAAFGETMTLHNLENQHAFGYAFGFTLSGCKRFHFTLEKRFTNQNAFYFNAGMQF